MRLNKILKTLMLIVVLSELWVWLKKASIKNTCFFYVQTLLKYGYSWYNDSITNEEMI